MTRHKKVPAARSGLRMARVSSAIAAGLLLACLGSGSAGAEKYSACRTWQTFDPVNPEFSITSMDFDQNGSLPKVVKLQAMNTALIVRPNSPNIETNLWLAKSMAQLMLLSNATGYTMRIARKSDINTRCSDLLPQDAKLIVCPSKGTLCN